MFKNNKPIKIIFLSGLPGVGKTTLLENLPKSKEIEIIYPGKELRILAQEQDYIRELLEKGTCQEELEDTVEKIISNKIFNIFDNEESTINKVIIDGYPRTEKQFKTLYNNRGFPVINPNANKIEYYTNIEFISVELEIDISVAFSRVLSRSDRKIDKDINVKRQNEYLLITKNLLRYYSELFSKKIIFDNNMLMLAASTSEFNRIINDL